MNKIKYILIFRFIIVLVVIGAIIYIYMNQKEMKNLLISDQTYRVEVVKSATEQTKGLSRRDNINNIDGMLFVYEDSQIRSFWMKDMKFDIDIVWINNEKIIGFSEKVNYQNQEKHYQPKSKCDMVLEISSGRIDKDNLKIGDKVRLK